MGRVSVSSVKNSQPEIMSWNFMVGSPFLVVAVLVSAVSGGYVTKAPSPAKNCHTEYETVTAYEQQCSTSYERDCNTVQLQECTPRVEKICSAQKFKECSTRHEELCTPSNREAVWFLTNRSAKLPQKTCVQPLMNSSALPLILNNARLHTNMNVVL